MMNKTTDIIVIGSGIGGLCCAGLLAHYGFDVIVCESHIIPGGAAHSFERNGFKFDSGPSLYSGLSYRPSTNPLRQVLDILEEDIHWINYDAWGCCLPEGDYRIAVGVDHFAQILEQVRGKDAVKQWRKLQEIMQPLASAATALPSSAMRYDWKALITMGRFAPRLITQLPHFSKIQGAFSQIMEQVISDRFIHNWLDLLCFMLSGLPASGTSAAEMAFMFAEWYQPNAVLDYPVGGSSAIIEALVRGLERRGGELRLGTHVAQILVEKQRAVGVKLSNGQIIKATKGVVSNASVWDTLNLLPEGSLPSSYRQQKENLPANESFMHLHLGIDGKNLPQDLECHYLVVNDWEKGITAPQNVVAISIPSLLDPSLAPLGKHSIHVYTPATEPYSLWQGLKRGSPEYLALKEERSQIMWQALERIIPDIRQRCELTLVGTPLTHQRFLRRYNGSYGVALSAAVSIFPSGKTPLTGLLCCGDSTFPGIGVPAVAASGQIAANTFAPLGKHLASI